MLVRGEILLNPVWFLNVAHKGEAMPEARKKVKGKSIDYDEMEPGIRIQETGG